jgi:hypothetical protein
VSVTGFELEVGLVIEIDMAHTDLAQLRFAHSPVRELVASMRVLHDRSRHQMYGAWLSTVRGRLGGLRVDLLTALAPSTPYSLDFAAPSSTRPPWTCRRPLPSWPGSSASARPRSASTSRSSRAVPWSTGQRRGRLVLYRRTEAATALLATIPPDEDGPATPGRP